jgi:hypothetical protein
MSATTKLFLTWLYTAALTVLLLACSHTEDKLQERLSSQDYSVRVLAVTDLLEIDAKATGQIEETTISQINRLLADFPNMEDKKSYRVLKALGQSKKSREWLPGSLEHYVDTYRIILKRENIR